MKKILLLFLIVFISCDVITNQKIDSEYHKNTVFVSDNEYPENFENKKAEKLYNKAIFYQSIRNIDKAIELYKKSIDLEPNEATFNQLGLSYNTKYEHKSGLNSFQDAIKLNPTFWAAQYNLAHSYFYFKDYENSEKILNKIISNSNSKHFIDSSYLILAAIYNNRKDYKTAYKLINKCKDLKDDTEMRNFYNKIRGIIIKQMN